MATAEAGVAKAVIGPPWLGDFGAFIDSLRKDSYGIGLAEELRAHELLVRLCATGVPLGSPDAVATWLAPVLCSDRTEQDLFPERVRDWAKAHGWLEVPTSDVAGKQTLKLSHDSPPIDGGKTGRRAARLWRVVTILVAGIVAIGIAYWALVGGHGPDTVTTQLPDVKLAGMSFEWLAGLRFALIPLIVYFVARYAWRQRKSILDRRLGLRDARRQELQLTYSERYLFRSLDLHRPFQALRAHRRVASTRINVRATLASTVANGGRVTVRYARRAQLPHYVLLAERLSTHDHMAKLGEVLAARLREEQVQFARFEFNADPRVVRQAFGQRSLRIADVATTHGESTLLILSDGESLINSLTGVPYGWLAELQRLFPTVILLTPIPLRRWSWREQTLLRAGWVVLPIGPEGFGALAHFLNAGAEPPQIGRGRRPARESLIAHEGTSALRWMMDAPVPDEEQQAIMSALAQELPVPAFELLTAVALFPEVRLDVTLHLGFALKRRDGTPLLDDYGLGALARLPWLRLGRIPDWLRLALIERLSPRRESEVRRELLALLAKPLVGTGDNTSLQVARQEPRSMFRWLQRKTETDEGATYRDVIFLSFMRGEKPDRLALEAPDALTRLMRPDTTRSERLWFVFAIALAAVTAFSSLVFKRVTERQLFEDGGSGELILLLVAAGCIATALVSWHVRCLARAGWIRKLALPPVYPAATAAIALILVAHASASIYFAMLVATLALIPVMATPVSPGELPPPISQEVISSAWALMTLLTVAIAAGAVAGALPRLEGEGDAVFSMFLIIGLGQASAVVVLASLSRRRWTPEWWRIIVPLSLFQFVGFVVTLFLIGFASEAMGMNLRDEILLGSCIHGAFLVLGYFTIVAVLGTRSIAFSFRWLLLGVLMMAVGATEWMKLLGLSMRAVEPAEWMKSWPAVPMLMFVAARHALLNLQTHRNPVPTIGSALNLQRLALWIATLALMTLLKFGCSSVLPSVIDLTGKPFGSSMYFILEGVRGGLLDALVFATFWLGFRYFYVSRIDLRDLRRWALDVTSTT